MEKLRFDITLSGTYWNKKPEYSILVDDTEVVGKTEIATASDEHFHVEFEHELEDGKHSLKVRLENKQSSDTEILEDGSIGRDMLLNIESINIDDIDIGTLKWTLSHYTTDKEVDVDGEKTNRLTNCINLGWNGAYTLEFESPYYLWLLESL